jgi:DNA processing protein
LPGIADENIVSQIPSHETIHPATEPHASPAALDWLSLLLLPGFGRSMIHRLVVRFCTPELVFSATPQQLGEVEGVGGKMAAMLAGGAQVKVARQKAAQMIQQSVELGYSVICPEDRLYPERLRHAEDAPVVLYCHGNVCLLTMPTVAIVGSRAATSYGKRVSFELGRELARHGIGVVSGMAMGIDGEAHRGALAGGGKTIGILGCGIDVIYPHQHKKLFQEVAESGVLISEYPPGTPPDAFRFPERNRIISGIASGTVVVEASLKSGSLITARLALDQGRDVFAVPGRIDSAKSQGTHRLLQQGAKLVNSVNDILEEFDMAELSAAAEKSAHAGACKVELQEGEEKLLSCLDVYPVTIDELVQESGYDTSTVFQMLLRLELQGVIRQLPGQQYELVNSQ